MNLMITAIDRETGEFADFDLSIIKDLSNDDVANLRVDTKKIEAIGKAADKEIKERLDKGEKFTRVSYGNPQVTRNLILDESAKKALIKKYGWESVEPLTIAKLEKKFGEKITEDLEPYIVNVPKNPAIQWDK
ncbi:hypothetical protein BG262_02720 [Floricoccus penangensis]|uniref:Phage protein n=1 Tax=Floricoccus penangensis TaxID=1859475 RepID=A0A9Q5JGM0_9LACT|nr:hypothetical protein [Floricoccus penangensis]OFI46729.1 hypothetical protein BG262_02720 [Floricoccus penangensis]